ACPGRSARCTKPPERLPWYLCPANDSPPRLRTGSGVLERRLRVATKSRTKPAPAKTKTGRGGKPSSNGSSAGGPSRIAPLSAAARKLRQEVIDRADRHQVQVVNMWFTDILGQLKSFV